MALGISRDTLQVRKREGLFQAGRDYIRTGRHAKSPCLWNIQSARAQMALWAARLVELGLSSEVKPYAQIQAILGAFSVIDKGVTDRENAEQLAKVRETLERLEGGPPNVIDV